MGTAERLPSRCSHLTKETIGYEFDDPESHTTSMDRLGDRHTMMIADSEDRLASVGFRPLYRQVYDTFLRRLADGVWQPGQVLPSEALLALEIGVSQGTVRKALNTLTVENLLVRRQGRGTFVAEHDDRQSVFRFFKLRSDGEGDGVPTSRVMSIIETAASVDERDRLDLVRSARVVRVKRLRSLDTRPCVAETISVPSLLFPGLAEMDLPNTLYSLYATQFGITIAGASEKLKAILLPSKDAGLLTSREGAPALEIDRIAYDLESRRVEWRLSLCLTDHIHYASDLG